MRCVDELVTTQIKPADAEDYFRGTVYCAVQVRVLKWNSVGSNQLNETCRPVFASFFFFWGGGVKEEHRKSKNNIFNLGNLDRRG